MLEIKKAISLPGGRKGKDAYKISCLLLETLENWGGSLGNGRVFWQIMYEASQHLPPETEKQMERDPAGK